MVAVDLSWSAIATEKAFLFALAIFNSIFAVMLVGIICHAILEFKANYSSMDSKPPIIGFLMRLLFIVSTFLCCLCFAISSWSDLYSIATESTTALRFCEIIWFLFTELYAAQNCLLILTLFCRIWFVFEGSTMQISKCSVYCFITLCVAFAAVLCVLYELTAWHAAMAQRQHLNINATDIWIVYILVGYALMMAFTAILNSSFIYKLVHVFNKDTNAYNFNIVEVHPIIYKIIVLCTLNLIATVLCALVLILEKLFPLIPLLVMLSKLVICVHLVVNLLLIVLSQQAYNAYYLRLCACVHTPCLLTLFSADFEAEQLDAKYDAAMHRQPKQQRSSPINIDAETDRVSAWSKQELRLDIQDKLNAINLGSSHTNSACSMWSTSSPTITIPANYVIPPLLLTAVHTPPRSPCLLPVNRQIFVVEPPRMHLAAQRNEVRRNAQWPERHCFM